jgi:hypothetical protein
MRSGSIVLDVDTIEEGAVREDLDQCEAGREDEQDDG